MTTWREQIDRGVELLELCLKLQNAQDGVDRVSPFVFDKTKVLDQFTQDICAAITLMQTLNFHIPMMLRLVKVGEKLEAEGKITLKFGESLSTGALNYICSQYEIE